MKSLKEWRKYQLHEDAAWDQIKSMQIQGDSDIKNFVSSKIEYAVEELIKHMSQQNPKIQNFRDVPPEVRDAIAKSMISSVLDLFYEGMRSSPANYPKPIQKQNQTQNDLLPQDELKTPAASRG
jgi:hypothetical protein